LLRGLRKIGIVPDGCELTRPAPWRAKHFHDSLGLSSAGASQSKAARFFWTFLALHILVWTVAPIFAQPNRPLDMIEMLFWGRYWQFGYYKHPPLPAWIVASIEQLSLGAIWPFYLAAQLIVATSFWSAWRLAKEFLPAWPAVCASLLMETSIHYNLATTDLNNSIVEQPLWALSVLLLYWAITRGSVGYWIGSGICLGLGMMSKYDIAMLAISMIVLAAVNARARSALGTPGPWLMLAASLLVFSPHALWLIQNDFPTITYVGTRAENGRSLLGHIVNPVEFLLSQSLVHVPMLAVAYPLWRRAARAQVSTASSEPLNTFQRDFLLLMGLGPFVLDLLASAISGAQLKSMWGAPMWTFSGLLVMVWFRHTATPAVCRRVVWTCVCVSIVMLSAYLGRNLALPHWRHKASRVHFPGAALAQTIEDEWARHSDRPLEIVGGSWWAAANIGIHSPSRPVMYDFGDPKYSPWAGDEDLKRTGGMLVWEDDQYAYLFEEARQAKFPDSEVLPVLEIDYATSAKIPPARFYVAVVRPSTADSKSNASAGATVSRETRPD
jgi:4-amino-4-deoxy-L-arabinose transferase-like glycosyltransferase